jgi:PIN domain nuclease of toxin-antitoxin system
MIIQVNVHEAKTPVAHLMAVEPAAREFGFMVGAKIPDSFFFDPMTEEELAHSAFEVATKVRLGRFDDARWLTEGWLSTVARLSAQSLSVTTAHALLGGSLDWAHRDPVDRRLVAQSLVDELVLVTADRALFDAPGVELLRW